MCVGSGVCVGCGAIAAHFTGVVGMNCFAVADSIGDTGVELVVVIVVVAVVVVAVVALSVVVVAVVVVAVSCIAVAGVSFAGVVVP